jgi:hypothetical protein
MPAKIDVSGKVFGRWTVVGEPKVQTKSRRVVTCQCECGVVRDVFVSNLLRDDEKRSQSCGCLKLEKSTERLTTHGRTNSREYSVWAGMVQRTTNHNSKAYKNYGGRGIKLCSRWTKFEKFFRDMGPRPSRWHSLDRVDNNKGYSPENVIWETRKGQNCNKRNNRRIEWLGKTWVMAELANFLRVKYHNLQHALNTSQNNVEIAVYLLVSRGYIPNLFGKVSAPLGRKVVRDLRRAGMTSSALTRPTRRLCAG